MYLLELHAQTACSILSGSALSAYAIFSEKVVFDILGQTPVMCFIELDFDSSDVVFVLYLTCCFVTILDTIVNDTSVT